VTFRPATGDVDLRASDGLTQRVTRFAQSSSLTETFLPSGQCRFPRLADVQIDRCRGGVRVGAGGWPPTGAGNRRQQEGLRRGPTRVRQLPREGKGSRIAGRPEGMPRS